MQTFLNCDLSTFGSNLSNVTIKNYIRNRQNFLTFSQCTNFCVPYILTTIEVRNSKKRQKIRIFLMYSQYSFQTDYMSIATRLRFVKMDAKLHRSFVNLIVKITCSLG